MCGGEDRNGRGKGARTHDAGKLSLPAQRPCDPTAALAPATAAAPLAPLRLSSRAAAPAIATTKAGHGTTGGRPANDGAPRGGGNHEICRARERTGWYRGRAPPWNGAARSLSPGTPTRHAHARARRRRRPSKKKKRGKDRGPVWLSSTSSAHDSREKNLTCMEY